MDGTQTLRDKIAQSHPLRLVVGSGSDVYDGWHCLKQSDLDILEADRWAALFEPASIDAILAEHVFEHLYPDGVLTTLENAFAYLKPGAHFRIAVPDGFHPDPAYVDAVRPGGTGSGASDHKILWDYKKMQTLVRAAGFDAVLREYMDEDGQFHFDEWASEDGHVKRSSRYDWRNQKGEMRYTSLIVDAIKPKVAATDKPARPDISSAWQDVAGGPKKVTETSWIKSNKAKTPLNALGDPIPWYTYAAIDFLDHYLSVQDVSNLQVFEFGAGQSTLYFLNQGVGLVRSVDANPKWVDDVQTRAGGNPALDLSHVARRDMPQSMLRQQGDKYDIICIDGSHRVQCALNAYAHMAPGGIIVFDNSDRPRYETGMTFLDECGLTRIDFYGRSPGIQWKTCTSVFLSDPGVLKKLPRPTTHLSVTGPNLGHVE